MHGGKISDTWVNELLKEGHEESPNGFAIKSQINNCYVSSFTHNQKNAKQK